MGKSHHREVRKYHQRSMGHFFCHSKCCCSVENEIVIGQEVDQSKEKVKFRHSLEDPIDED
jgi:hypothetical protein